MVTISITISVGSRLDTATKESTPGGIHLERTNIVFHN